MTNYLDHIERINPKVNAIVALQDRAGLLAQASERDAQLARGDLMGPLHGFPYDPLARACARRNHCGPHFFPVRVIHEDVCVADATPGRCHLVSSMSLSTPREKPQILWCSHVGIHSPETDPRTQRRGRRSCAHRHRIRTGLFEPKSPLRGNGIFRAETKRPKRPWRFKNADAETKSR